MAKKVSFHNKSRLSVRFPNTTPASTLINVLEMYLSSEATMHSDGTEVLNVEQKRLEL